MKHLLIDFENIQPQNLDNLPTEDTHIWLFLGAVHKNLPIELVQSLLRFGERAHLIRLQKTGKNALDFYLSYYLGQITATDPQAAIGILSRDGGYDILVEHIAENQQAQSIIRLATLNEVQAAPKIVNYENFATLSEKQPENTPVTKKTILPIFQAALTALRAPDAFRPSRLHNLQLNLRNHILCKLIAEQDLYEQELTVHKVINKLKDQRLISIDDNEWVTYHLDNLDILLKIQKYILNIKPSTLADFQNKVKERAEILCLEVENGDIQKFVDYLHKKNLIRQNNGKIEYAPFSQPKTQPETQSKKYQPDETILQKVIAAISVSKTKRAQKVSSLKNVIKVHAKCSDAETENLFQYLQDKKYIQVNGNKIIYLK